MFLLSAMDRLSPHRRFSRCSLPYHTTQTLGFLRSGNGLPLLISCKNSKNSGSPFEERVGEAPWTALDSDPDFDLRVRFAVDQLRIQPWAIAGTTIYCSAGKPEAVTG